MQGDNQASTCCEQEPLAEHSGQMFDWWRYSQDGRILQPPRGPPPQPAYHRPPLRTDQLCWPMYQVTKYENIDKERNKPDPDGCDISKEYWPETTKKYATKVKLEHARPPWIPASNPNNTSCCSRGMKKSTHIIKFTERQKPVQPCISSR